MSACLSVASGGEQLDNATAFARSSISDVGSSRPTGRVLREQPAYVVDQVATSAAGGLACWSRTVPGPLLRSSAWVGERYGFGDVPVDRDR